MELPRIDTANLLDKTYTILKEQIVHRKFKPNEKLSIPDLADQLGVSRTPIRDALNRLEMDGLEFGEFGVQRRAAEQDRRQGIVEVVGDKTPGALTFPDAPGRADG